MLLPLDMLTQLPAHLYHFVAAGRAHAVFLHSLVPGAVIRIAHAEPLDPLECLLFPELVAHESASARSACLADTVFAAQHISSAQTLSLLHAPAAIKQCVCCTDCLLVEDALDVRGASQADFTVEIKPKSGIAEKRSRKPPSSSSSSSFASRFTRLQHFRYQSGVSHRLSEFDPIELFSCDRARMIATLLACAESHPRSNLTVRKRTSSSGFDSSWLEDAIGGSVRMCDSAVDHATIRAVLAACVDALLQLELLQHLLQLQRLGNHLDAYNAYRLAIGLSSSATEAANDDTMGKEEMNANLQALRNYMIAAIAKDVSIAIMLHEVQSVTEERSSSSKALYIPNSPCDCIVHERDSGRVFQCSVRCLDISLKRISKLKQWYEQEEQLLAFERAPVA